MMILNHVCQNQKAAPESGKQRAGNDWGDMQGESQCKKSCLGAELSIPGINLGWSAICLTFYPVAYFLVLIINSPLHIS